MPRYFFNVRNGKDSPDRNGTELLDLASARAAAVRFSGEVLRDMGAKFWDATEWKLEVCNENRHALFVLSFSAEECPTPPDVPRKTA